MQTIHRNLGAALLAALLLAGCQTAGPSVSVNYYTVSGQTQRELDEAIRRQGPEGGDALALASIQLVPSVRVGMGAQGCRVTRARIRVKAEVTLPRWAERRFTQDRALGRAWDNLESYARYHEAVHVAIAETHAKLLEEALLAMPPRPDCEDLNERSLRLAREILERHHRTQLQFDAAEKKRFAALAR